LTSRLDRRLVAGGERIGVLAKPFAGSCEPVAEQPPGGHAADSDRLVDHALGEIGELVFEPVEERRVRLGSGWALVEHDELKGAGDSAGADCVVETKEMLEAVARRRGIGSPSFRLAPPRTVEVVREESAAAGASYCSEIDRLGAPRQGSQVLASTAIVPASVCSTVSSVGPVGARTPSTRNSRSKVNVPIGRPNSPSREMNGARKFTAISAEDSAEQKAMFPALVTLSSPPAPCEIARRHLTDG
jgi:hypothetical protein